MRAPFVFLVLPRQPAYTQFPLAAPSRSLQTAEVTLKGAKGFAWNGQRHAASSLQSSKKVQETLPVPHHTAVSALTLLS